MGKLRDVAFFSSLAKGIEDRKQKQIEFKAKKFDLEERKRASEQQFKLNELRIKGLKQKGLIDDKVFGLVLKGFEQEEKEKKKKTDVFFEAGMEQVGTEEFQNNKKLNHLTKIGQQAVQLQSIGGSFTDHIANTFGSGVSERKVDSIDKVIGTLEVSIEQGKIKNLKQAESVAKIKLGSKYKENFPEVQEMIENSIEAKQLQDARKREQEVKNSPIGRGIQAGIDKGRIKIEIQGKSGTIPKNKLDQFVKMGATIV